PEKTSHEGRDPAEQGSLDAELAVAVFGGEHSRSFVAVAWQLASAGDWMTYGRRRRPPPYEGDSVNQNVPAPTQRLAFRQMTADDIDNMAALLGDPDVMRYYPRPKDRG